MTSVVFPAPFSPTSASASPARRWNAEVAQDPPLRAGIAEADALEREALADRLGERQRLGGRHDAGRDLEEREEVVEVERLPGDGREAREQPFEERAEAAERAGEEREVADREVAADGAVDDDGVGGVIPQRADGGEARAPPGAADGEAAVGLVKRVGEIAVALGQEVVEAEDLDLFGRLVARAGEAEVVEFAALGRPRVRQRVRLRVEVRLAEERRDEGEHEQHDQPRRIHHEPDAEADDRDDVLRLAEDLAHQHHPAGRLAAGAFELVVEVGVLEVGEVERGGVGHEADARLVREEVAEERVEEGDGAAERVGEDREAELGGDEHDERLQLPARPPRRRARRARAPPRRGGRPRR